MKNNIVFAGEQVQEVWNNLYDQFRNAYKEQVNLPSGSAPVQITFVYYDNMLFLKDHLERPEVLSSMNVIPAANKRNSVWQKHISKKSNPSACTPAKVPKLDDFAAKKWQQKSDLQNVSATIAKIADEASKILAKKTEQLKEDNTAKSDYYNLIKLKFQKIKNICDSDDCFDEVLKEVNKYKSQ